MTIDLSGLSNSSYTVSRTLEDANDNDAIVSTSTMSGPSGSLSFTLAGEGLRWSLSRPLD